MSSCLCPVHPCLVRCHSVFDRCCLTTAPQAILRQRFAGLANIEQRHGLPGDAVIAVGKFQIVEAVNNYQRIAVYKKTINKKDRGDRYGGKYDARGMPMRGASRSSYPYDEERAQSKYSDEEWTSVGKAERRGREGEQECGPWSGFCGGSCRLTLRRFLRRALVCPVRFLLPLGSPISDVCPLTSDLRPVIVTQRLLCLRLRLWLRQRISGQGQNIFH